MPERILWKMLDILQKLTKIVKVILLILLLILPFGFPILLLIGFLRYWLRKKHDKNI